jgi:hypothetical protein
VVPACRRRDIAAQAGLNTDATSQETTLARTAAPQTSAPPRVLSLKVTLRNTRPPIWRRLLVPAGMTLADLHVAIQVTMGWHDCHLHDFNVGGKHYGDPATVDDVADERRLKLNALAGSGVTRFAYSYDFGDNWEHEILIEAKAPPTEAKAFPACIAGKRHCPPENCGGVWGYAELLEVLANPAHPQHNDQVEWLGDAFDPEAFSVAEADAALATAFRRKQPATS